MRFTSFPSMSKATNRPYMSSSPWKQIPKWRNSLPTHSPISPNPFPPPPPPLPPAIIRPPSSKNGFVFLVDRVNLETILSGVVACICLQFVMWWMDAIWKIRSFTRFDPWYSIWFCEKMQYGPCFCSQLGIGWKKKTINLFQKNQNWFKDWVLLNACDCWAMWIWAMCGCSC